MNCDDYRRLKHELLDAELPDETAQELAAHLEACSACAAAWRSLTGLRGLLARSAVEEAPTDVAGQALAAIAAAAGPPAIMTPAEVAALLRVTEAELALIWHEMPHFTVAGKVRIRREAVERWIAIQEERTAAAALGGPVLALIVEEGAAWALVG